MDDDIIFSAKTGKQITAPSDVPRSYVIPLPRRRTAVPKPDSSDNYAEQVTIHCSATFQDNATRAEIVALAKPIRESDDI